MQEIWKRDLIVDKEENTINSGIENEAEVEQKWSRSGAEVEQKNEAEKLSLREIKMLGLIKNDNKISRLKIANLLKISESSVYREIEKLKKMGILERINGDRGGYWKIKQ